jgi:long-subunit fatty acid transport protein
MNEKNPSIIESVKSKEKRFGATTKLAAVAGGLTLALAGCSSSFDKPDYGEPNPAATSVTIENGANLRTSPNVGSSADEATLLHTVELDTIATEVVVPTPHGVYEHHDSANGNWIGISATDLPQAFNDEYSDSDGIIWVNEQMAKETVVANQLKASS